MNKGTRIAIPIEELNSLSSKKWGSTVGPHNNTTRITYDVMTPCDASVGKYDIKVNYLRKNDAGSWRLAAKRMTLIENMILLFNAWCQGNVPKKGITYFYL